MAGLIVHEWIEKTGGAEKVLEQLLRAFPDAGLSVLWNDLPTEYPSARESWIARTRLRNHKALVVPLLPLTWRFLKADPVPDWLLVSSHLFAHHAAVRNKASEIPKFTYAHTPARYIWEPDLDTRAATPLMRLGARLLQPLDRRRSRESQKLAANSRFTRERIRRTWQRDAEVIYPPVDVERILRVKDWKTELTLAEFEILDSLPEQFLLGASRFVPYKRLDAVIEAGEAIDMPVVLAGRGPGLEALRRRAADSTVPVRILVSPSDELLYSLYQGSSAYVFPAVEDFGIMPVEAMAAGATVLVPSIGGAAESVELVGSGGIIEDFSVAGWKRAFDQLPSPNIADTRSRVMQFGNDRFQREIRHWVNGN